MQIRLLENFIGKDKMTYDKNSILSCLKVKNSYFASLQLVDGKIPIDSITHSVTFEIKDDHLLATLTELDTPASAILKSIDKDKIDHRFACFGFINNNTVDVQEIIGILWTFE